MSPVSGALSGAREGRSSPFRRLVSRAMARELSAFVVPGMEIARANGLDLRATGLAIASTPRHANVLLVVGKLPEALAEAAIVAYAQMPRPRAVLAVGSSEESLPIAPDVSVVLDQGSLEYGVADLRRRFSEVAFDTRVEPYEADVLESETEYACPMHPEVVQDEPGTCPKCGMDLVAQEAGGGGHDHGGHDHSSEDDGESGESDEGSGEKWDLIPGPVAGEDFMSMVEMTEGTPRSSDGLQMEWVRTPFGPLFPGLPGGLGLAFTLDGDTVARVEVGAVTGDRTELRGPLGSLEERAARLDPLSPLCYRLLARRAVEGALYLGSGWIQALERERAGSHLSWLAGFGHLLGYAWLSRRAGELQLAVQRGEEMPGLRTAARSLSRQVERTPLLRRKLSGVGEATTLESVAGPVARAAGIGGDARAGDGGYAALGFEPVLGHGNDALARLRLRLAEIEQSLALVERAAAEGAENESSGSETSGPVVGEATIETPRGAAALSVGLEDGELVRAELRTPSDPHLRLVEGVTLQRELGDALVGVASLDLSPWSSAG